MRVTAWTLACVLAAATVGYVCGHGRLISPPGRSTMWRYGFKTTPNYNDNQLFCGGFSYQQSKAYKCGVCGDPWGGPLDNEVGGKYYSGIIVRTYKPGAAINVKVHITAHHKGWFEFKLCPITKDTKNVTHECLDKYPLQLVDRSGSRYSLPNLGARVYTVKLRLPSALQCDRCVLQWRYHTGNSWGIDTHPVTGKNESCLGCGEQEEFYGCADIRIKGDNSSGSDTTTKASIETSTKPSPTTTSKTTSITTTPKTSSATTTTRKTSSTTTTTAKTSSTTTTPTTTARTSSTTTTTPTTTSKTTTLSTTTKGTTSEPTSWKPTTTTSPSSGGDIKCRGVYPYNTESQKQWCYDNCPEYCPSSHCECGPTLTPEKEKKRCVWIRASHNQASSDKWCSDNCNHVPPYCPKTFCRCN